MDMLNRLARRILSVVGRGRITVVNDTGAVQTAQVSVNSLETMDNLPRIAEYGLTSYPPAGTDVVSVFLGGDRSTGLIIATNNQQYRLKGLSVGDVAIYDSRGQSVWLTSAGIVVNGSGLPLTVNNTPTVTVNAQTKIALNTPELDVSGNIKSGGTVSAAGDITDNTSSGNSQTMAKMRSIYDGHSHPVTGVQSGSSTVITNPPNQQE